MVVALIPTSPAVGADEQKQTDSDARGPREHLEERRRRKLVYRHKAVDMHQGRLISVLQLHLGTCRCVTHPSSFDVDAGFGFCHSAPARHHRCQFGREIRGTWEKSRQNTA